MWAYEQLGVNLEHRASKQQSAGTKVKSPKAGDIVVFTYNGSKSAYHTGIYLTPDTMIHAGGGKGDSTSIISISKFAGKYSKVTYRRILETI
jgi:cell wall-associated NlpC family hydrolase